MEMFKNSKIYPYFQFGGLLLDSFIPDKPDM